MASILSLSTYDFNTQEIRALNELLFDEFLKAPALNVIHTIFSGIEYDAFIGFIGEAGLVGKAGQGCNPTPDTLSIATRQSKWSPKKWEIYLNECVTDIEASCAVYALNKGVSRADLTNTDYMAVIVSVLAPAIDKFLWRLIWFNDTDAENYVPAVGQTPASGGVITPAVDLDYFTILDGLWKQLFDAVITTPSLKVEIAANLEATTDAQFNSLTGTAANEILNKMLRAAPMVMRNPANAMFVCTQSFADAYQMYLEDIKVPANYENLVNGMAVLKKRGYSLLPLPIWDEMIQMYEQVGTKLNNPHRCILIEKTNLAVGTPSSDVLKTIDIFYDRKSKINVIDVADSLDAKLLNTTRFVLAI